MQSSISPWRHQEEEDIHQAHSVIISAARPAALTFIKDTDVIRQVGERNLLAQEEKLWLLLRKAIGLFNSITGVFLQQRCVQLCGPEL